jgi:bifunctional DNase/RNase
MLIDTSGGGSYVLLSAEEKEIGVPLNSIEATMFIFIQSDCNSKPHINNIYSLYLKTLNELNMKIVSAIIEAKSGDMMYARLCLLDQKNRNFYCQCTVGDAIIFSELTDAKLQIVRKVLDDLEPFDMNYEDDDIDYEEDE